MTFKPYADTPVRRTVQLAADLTVLVWVVAWVLVGKAVYDTIRALADLGYGLEGRTTGLSADFTDASNSAGGVPLVGDALGAPLRLAADAVASLGGAGGDAGDRFATLAWQLGVGVAAFPLLLVVGVWALLRWRFARRAAAALRMAGAPGGEDLLALRALASRRLSELAQVCPDPVDAWRRGDGVAVARLADLELRRCGVRGRPPAVST
jgi:hypothetical protein